jgi:hypothetical protein
MESQFFNIDTGAIVIRGGFINLGSCVFENNIVANAGFDYAPFPNVRHNVYIEQGATIELNDITDSAGSTFIYGDTGTTIKNNDANPPTSVPKLYSIAGEIVKEMPTTIFELTGDLIFPGSQKFAYFSERNIGQLSELYDVVVVNQTFATVELSNSLFVGLTGKYYGVLLYGLLFETRSDSENIVPSPYLLLFDFGVGASEDENEADNLQQRIMIIVIVVSSVVVVIVAILVIIIICLLQRKPKSTKKSKKDETSKINMDEVYYFFLI